MKEKTLKWKIANWIAFGLLFFGFPLACWYIFISVVKFLYKLIFG